MNCNIYMINLVIVREKSVDLPQCSSSDSENHALHNERKVTTSAQMNMRAVYLHVLGDALGSVIVIASSLCIIYGEGDWTLYVDPGMSLVMVLIIMKSSVPLLKESALILMQTVPTHIKIQEVRERLLQQVDGVLSLHEFHVWQLAGDKIIGKCTVCVVLTTPLVCQYLDYNFQTLSKKTTFVVSVLRKNRPSLRTLNVWLFSQLLNKFFKTFSSTSKTGENFKILPLSTLQRLLTSRVVPWQIICP